MWASPWLLNQSTLEPPPSHPPPGWPPARAKSGKSFCFFFQKEGFLFFFEKKNQKTFIYFDLR
jgi:hypothetical protein